MQEIRNVRGKGGMLSFYEDLGAKCDAGDSTLESRHENFLFPSLDLRYCCFSLSCGLSKPEPG